MKLMVTLCIACLSLSLAQETCESLLVGLEQSLAQTQSLERTTTIKAGFIEVGSVSAVVKQTSSGLEVIETERSGRQLPDRPSDAETVEAGWLGPFGVEVFSCEGHSLRPLAEGRYELELVEEDDRTPPQTFKLGFKPQDEKFVLETLKVKIKAPGIPVSPDITVTFESWTFVTD